MPASATTPARRPDQRVLSTNFSNIALWKFCASASFVCSGSAMCSLPWLFGWIRSRVAG